MDELVATVSRALKIDHGCAGVGIRRFIESGKGVDDSGTGLVYARSLFDAEKVVADSIIRLASNRGRCLDRNAAEKAIGIAERQTGIELDDGQREAAASALMHPVCAIVGGPGVGKSMTMKVITCAMANGNGRIGLAAPTGRAGKVLAEKTGRDAGTIHRMLGWLHATQSFIHGPDKPLEYDHVVVDEYSMPDIRLAAAHLSAQPDGSSILFVGDIDQLASIGPGQVLRDIIESGVIHVARLTKVHRQAEGSGVALAVEAIKSGLHPFETGEELRGVRMVQCADRDIGRHVVSILRSEMPRMGFDPLRDVQILSSMNKGSHGTIALNAAVKSVLNPIRDDGRSCTLAGNDFSVDDRIMQNENARAKGVYNGDIGIVESIGTEVVRGKSRVVMNADFSGIPVVYRAEDGDQVDLANACTVHKLQGGECAAVVFVVPEAHRTFLTRNLIYTGASRSRSELVFVGDTETIRASLSVVDGSRRHTGLARRLAAALPSLSPGGGRTRRRLEAIVHEDEGEEEEYELRSPTSRGPR